MKKLVLIVLAALMAIPLATVPARADGEIVPGPGSGSGSGGAGRDTVYCNDRGQGVLSNGTVIYEYPYPGCYGGGFNLSYVNQHWGNWQRFTCVVGWEVWRFYGTETDPVEYMTVSRVNADNGANGDPWGAFSQFGSHRAGCLDNGESVALFAPHPNDTGRSDTASAAMQTQSGADLWSRPSYYSTVNGQRYLTTAPPFRTGGTGSCDSRAQDRNDLATMLSWPSAQQYVADQAAFWTAAFGSTLGEEQVNQRVADDGIRCNSGLEYYGYAKNDPQRPVVGQCFIPIERLATRTWEFGEAHNISNSDVAFTSRGGERYHDDHFTEGDDNFFAVLGDRRLAQEIEDSVRDAIVYEVMTRAPGLDLAPRINGRVATNVITPGEPYPDAEHPFNGHTDPTADAIYRSWNMNDSHWSTGTSNGSNNREPAAIAASNYSFCSLNPLAAAEPPTQDLEPEAFLDVNVNVPSRFVTGGKNTPQTVNATPRSFTCNDCIVGEGTSNQGPGPYLANVEVNMSARSGTIRSVGGYQAWNETASSAAVLPRWNAPRWSRLEFYAGSANTGQGLRFTPNGDASYYYFPRYRTVVRNGIVTREWVRELRTDVTVRFNYPSLTRNVVGATAVAD